MHDFPAMPSYEPPEGPTPGYRPGDVINGHVLGADNQWHPLAVAPVMVAVDPMPNTNHILHLLLTVFTCGLWAPVWIIVSMVDAHARKVVSDRIQHPERISR